MLVTSSSPNARRFKTLPPFSSSNVPRHVRRSERPATVPRRAAGDRIFPSAHFNDDVVTCRWTHHRSILIIFDALNLNFLRDFVPVEDRSRSFVDLVLSFLSMFINSRSPSRSAEWKLLSTVELDFLPPSLPPSHVCLARREDGISAGDGIPPSGMSKVSLIVHCIVPPLFAFVAPGESVRYRHRSLIPATFRSTRAHIVERGRGMNR